MPETSSGNAFCTMLSPPIIKIIKSPIIGRVPKSLTYFYIFSNLLLFGGLESLLKSIFHNFFAGTKIVLIMELIIEGILSLKKDMVKTTMRFLNVKLVKNVLVKREVQYFSNLKLLRKKF